MPVGPSALIAGQDKLLLGKQAGAGWDGPLFPNASSTTNNPHGQVLDCGASGCLFDVLQDASEHNDLAASLPNVTATLRARLAFLTKGFFTNADAAPRFRCAHNASLSLEKECACDRAERLCGGFMCPAWAVAVESGEDAGARGVAAAGAP